MVENYWLLSIGNLDLGQSILLRFIQFAAGVEAITSEILQMSKRTTRHHEVPRWLLRNFRVVNSDLIWLAIKDRRQIKRISVSNTFVRCDRNTRIDFTGVDGRRLTATRSDQDEKILSDFDDRMARVARSFLSRANSILQKQAILTEIFPKFEVEMVKRLIVAQGRRTRESQDRIRLTCGTAPLYLDLFEARAKELGHVLPPRGELENDPSVTMLLSQLAQNERANFASGNDPILQKKELEFLRGCGLHVAILEKDSTPLLIGSHGLTIAPTDHGEQAWLPLAPNVAITLTAIPNSCSIGIYPASFADEQNRSAFQMSKMIAGNSEPVIQDLVSSSAN